MHVLVTWVGDGAYCGWSGSCMESLVSLATDFSGLGGEGGGVRELRIKRGNSAAGANICRLQLFVAG